LILADDASDAQQVRALLPPRGSALVVTSRVRFTLPGMLALDLEPLGEEAAVRLLRQLCGRLKAADARTLAKACGFLPLALRVSGSLLQNNPALSVATYLRQLTDERQRLYRLRDPDDPQLDVEAALRLSYARLNAQVQQMFRQLGVLVADFTSELAQAVVEIPAPIDIEATLHELLRHNLVMYDTERSRWRLHDLLRDLARHELEVMDEAEAAQWRYAWATVALAEQIQEHYLAGGDTALLALSQFDTERTHIDTARSWAQGHVQTPEGNQLLLDVALAMLSIQELRYDPQQKSTTLWDGVRMAARRLGKPTEEARAVNMLGDAYAHLDKLHTAISYYEQCLAITQALGDRRTESLTLHNLGLVYTLLGELHTATSYYEQNLAIVRDIGDRRSEAATLGNLGLTYQLLGKPQTAINYHEQDLAIVRELGNHRGEGVTLSNLGNAYTELGDTRRALEYCEAALSITRAIGDRRGEGYTLSYLARAQAIQGDRIHATISFTQAMTLFQEVNHRWGIAEGQWYFGLALAQHGDREQALPLLHAAVAYEQEIGYAKVTEHAALIACLEAGEGLPSELRVPHF
jgi:tetratricopeptide (TPR) repeat protein